MQMFFKVRGTNLYRVDMLFRWFAVAIFLVQSTRISTAKSYDGLLQEMRSAPNKTDAGLIFYANILGTNVTEVSRLRNENQSSFPANYVINYAGFLKRVTEEELEEMAKLAGNSASYNEYLRQWVNRGGDYDDEYWVSSLLDEMRKADGSGSADNMFAFTMKVRVAVYLKRGEIFH